MAQSNHATSTFAVEYPEIHSEWYKNSNYIACLEAKDEKSLIALAEKIQRHGIVVSIFREPDLKGQVTSIAVEPCDKARRLTSHLPKSFKPKPKEEENPP